MTSWKRFDYVDHPLYGEGVVVNCAGDTITVVFGNDFREFASTAESLTLHEGPPPSPTRLPSGRLPLPVGNRWFTMKKP